MANNFGINLGLFGANNPNGTQNISGALAEANRVSNLISSGGAGQGGYNGYRQAPGDTAQTADVTGGGTTGTGLSQAAYNQSLAQLNQAEQRAGNQYGVAQQNVNNGYQSALDQLLGAKANQDKVFDTTRLGQNQDYQSGRQDINQSVGNAYTGLQRLLGSRGAGNSSAASVLAPYAAGQQGNIQSTNLQNTYGKNVANLENSVNSYNTGFDNSKKDLETQKQTNLNAAESAYDNARAQILQSRAALNPGNAASYQQQINQLLGQVDQLALKPTFTPKTAEYVAPELAALQAGQIAPATLGGVSPGAVQQTGAFANLLAPEKKKLAGQSPVAVTA